MKSYDHKKIEQKWQKYWASKKLYKTADVVKGKENYFLLTEFPYPSGNLHVGHWYAFSIPDILARQMRMAGKNVMYPIGFDAFGLPAENAAIKNKLNPRKWTEKNIAYMTKQLQSMGTSFDWSREVRTIDPAYYKWTQWQFLQFYKNGLAYRKNTPANWCPSCKTVLANEQVVNGKCERCGTEVIQKEMMQWNIRITKYADRLVDDLDALDWPEQIKDSQRNWIGRSEGAHIDFPLELNGGKKYTYIILHGWEGAPDASRYQFWKKELEAQGHRVVIPALPNSANPREEEQVTAALNATEYDENTVLFGHSLGAVVAMKVLEKLQKPIARLVLAGGFADRDFQDKRRPFEKTFIWEFDAKKIKENVETIQILHDPTDTAISEGQRERLEKLLGVSATRLPGELPHYKGEKERSVLMWLRPTIRVFTTRPDTLYGATYMVLSPEHPWVTKALEHGTVLKNNDEVRSYVAAANKKTELERQENKVKTGVRLEGVEAINPANGKRIPLFIADYVLAHYGTGAIMAVPAHDERDFAFAKQFGVEVKEVVSGGNSEMPYTGDGALVNSGEYTGLKASDALPKMANVFGSITKTYKLRDWIVSRQRYWGVPIPIIHCPQCGEVAVPDKDLPVKLPEVKDYLPEGSGKSPLAKVKKWVNVKCPKCKGKAERETDTFDTFIDSSWYFQRYTDPKNKKSFADKRKLQAWLPVSLYSGGAEHTTMHVLYSRFWHKALFDLGLTNEPEPYARRMNRSLIMGPDGQKMSKSKGNVIDPDEVVARLGADTVRMYLAFIGPYNEVSSFPWNPDGVVGVRRFIERVWRLGQTIDATRKTSEDGERVMHQTIKKMSEDIPALKFNTAISQMMIFMNEAEKAGISKAHYETLLKLLAPFAPHVTEELWSALGHKKSIHLEKWPKYDEAKLISSTVTIAVQVNGKTRGTVTVPVDSDEKAVQEVARADAHIAKHLAGQKIVRVIYVKGRLLNFVVATS
jgi:leucyl-tRNA synthetase/predicted alpha/beta hydrolase family esterase